MGIGPENFGVQKKWDHFWFEYARWDEILGSVPRLPRLDNLGITQN